MVLNDEALPEADRLEGVPHPRETERLFGQDLAEQAFLNAARSGRMHHAWLLTGPKGVGKATLAWRGARFLLSRPPAGEIGLFGQEPDATSLDVASDHPVARRMAALSEPGLLLIRRLWDADKKRFKAQITVDEVRRLNSFFGLSAAEGGYRAVIVDSADDMNAAAANALLKVLEEPPRNAVLFLVSHRPARLLPTIRSRCRELSLGKLPPGDLARAMEQAGFPEAADTALAELSGGSVGEALRLRALGGLDLYADLIGLLSDAPRMDRQRAAALAEKCAAKGAEERLDLALRLMDTALSRLALAGAGRVPQHEAAQGEAEVLRHLSPNLRRAQAWADLSRDLGQRLRHARAVNIDAATGLMDALIKINETAGQS